MIPKIAHFHWTGPPMNWLRSISLISFKRLNPGWHVLLWDTPEDIRACNLPMYANEADWTWWRVVYEMGGFAFGTDSIFVKPVPEEWLDADLCMCPGQSRPFHHMTIGAKPGSVFMLDCVEECERRMGGPFSDQTLGIDLLNEVWSKTEYGMYVSVMPKSAYTPISSAEVDKLWAVDELVLPEDTIGVHWFGGHPTSKAHEPNVKPGYQAYIVRMAERVFE